MFGTVINVIYFLTQAVMWLRDGPKDAFDGHADMHVMRLGETNSSLFKALMLIVQEKILFVNSDCQNNICP